QGGAGEGQRAVVADAAAGTGAVVADLGVGDGQVRVGAEDGAARLGGGRLAVGQLQAGDRHVDDAAGSADAEDPGGVVAADGQAAWDTAPGDGHGVGDQQLAPRQGDGAAHQVRVEGDDGGAGPGVDQAEGLAQAQVAGAVVAVVLIGGV